MIVAQRPYSREEVARLIAEAQENWKKKKEQTDVTAMSLKKHRRWMVASKQINTVLEYLVAQKC